MSIRFRPQENRLNGIVGSAIHIPPDTEHQPTIARTPKPKAATASPPKKASLESSIKQTPTGCTCGLADKLVRSQQSEKETRVKLESSKSACDELKKELARVTAVSENELKEAETRWKGQLEKIDAQLKQEIQLKEEAVKKHLKCDEKSTNLSHQIDEMKKKHSDELDSLRKKHEAEMAALRKEKDEQVATREEKIIKLKTQIADKLTGNSSERQRQIDDLLKEMSRLQEEHEVLKAKLRAYGHAKNVQSICDNCTTSNARVKVLEDRLKDREALVSELKGMCDKFDRQLKQNDQLVTISHELEKARGKHK